MAVGKIENIFAGKGVTRSVHISYNMDRIDKIVEYTKKKKKLLIFINLIFTKNRVIDDCYIKNISFRLLIL